MLISRMILKSSSLIKTPFIWASIFRIENLPYMYFFTTASGPFVMLNCIFPLEPDFQVSGCWWQSHFSLPIGELSVHFYWQHLFLHGVCCSCFLPVFLSLWICSWFHEVCPFILSVVLQCLIWMSFSCFSQFQPYFRGCCFSC